MSEVIKLDRKLDAEAIVEITESVDSYLTGHNVQHKNRTLFMLESMLLDIKAHYEDPIDVSVSVIKKFGHSFIIVIYGEEEFNPAGNEEASFQTHILLANMGLAPSWIYKNKQNEITLEIPKNRLRGETRLLLAFLASVVVGFSGPLLPEAFLKFASEYILGTFSSVFMRLLAVFAGILIFFSILSGVCGMENISELSKNGKYMLKRTMIPSVVGTVVFGLALIPLFNFSFGERTGNGGVKEIYDVVMNVIPSNPVSPFQDGNMLQISLIAVITGSMMIILGNRVSAVKELALQGNALLISVVELICRMLPLYIFSDLTKLFWENGLSVITETWKPILLCYAVCFVIGLGMLVIMSLKYKVKIPVLFNKVRPSFMIGLTTASSMAAYGTALEINETKLGIDRGYTNFATPLKNQLHGLTAILGFLIAIYFCADYSDISVDMVWFACVWIYVFLIIPAIPPVSGGTLICLGILMKQLGIPSSCVGMAATLILIFDFVVTAVKILLVHMEEIEEADRLGLLDRSILMKE